MQIIEYVTLVTFFCLAPAGVLWLCRKSAWLGKIGPVLSLYTIGIIFGNTGFMSDTLPAVQGVISNAMIPLAIPLMLFGCTFRKSETRSQLLALLTGLTAVVAAVVAGYLIFGRHMEDGAKIGGMLSGVYTGGTINLAALKTMLDVSDGTYILVNSYDMVISFLYLTFLLSIGIRLFRKFLPYNAGAAGMEVTVSGQDNGNPYSGLFTGKGMKSASMSIGAALLVCALSAGIAIAVPENSFMVVFILSVTTFGIAFSFIPKVRSLKYSYDIGMYFIYIFCIAVASMADFSKLDIAGGLNLLGYLLVAVFGSLFIQALLAKLFKIDADTMVIASVTFINSPPFVPMMAAAMKNRNVLVTGLSIGIIGYAVGNYLGFLIYRLLEIL